MCGRRSTAACARSCRRATAAQSRRFWPTRCPISALFALLRAASPENVLDGVVPLVARVLVDRVAVVPLERDRDLPGLRVHRGIVDRDLVLNRIGGGSREALDNVERLALRDDL